MRRGYLYLSGPDLGKIEKKFRGFGEKDLVRRETGLILVCRFPSIEKGVGECSSVDPVEREMESIGSGSQSRVWGAFYSLVRNYEGRVGNIPW